MALVTRGVIEIPHSRNTSFDHGAFDPKTRRVFVAHTGRDCLEVIDHDTSRHVATLKGFPEAAGAVAHGGNVLVTNRGSATLAWLDAATLQTRFVSSTAPRPNGVAITSSGDFAIAACIGDDTHKPELQVSDSAGGRRSTLELPGRPRWCVVDEDDARVFLAIRDPTMVLAARLPDLSGVKHWPLPS
jgi:DNA-binding beta-propeller fold protein YncE